MKIFSDTVPLKTRTLYSLIKPRLANEDKRRREFILNVLLMGTLALAIVAFLIVAGAALILGSQYQGSHPVVVFLVAVLFLWLYMLSRAGMVRTAANIFIALYFVLATYLVALWGILLPQAILLYALVIVMAGILISSRSASYVMGLVAIVLAMATYAHSTGLIVPDITWAQEQGKVTDVVVFSLTLGIITLTAWLSNREIEKSLRRARHSESELRKQRNLLEVKVEARTKELQKIQMEKILEMYRFVELGRLSSSLLHDLANPLTSVSLDLKELGAQDRSQLLSRAVKGIRQIENFIHSARKQVQSQEELKWFSASNAINEAVQVLRGKAQDLKIKILFVKPKGYVQLYGNHIKFNQAILNLLSNALDAYDGSPAKKRAVSITLEATPKFMEVHIHNGGHVIAPKDLSQIFEPFFTTKHSTKGTGIGLTITKKIIEEDFKGKITVTSSHKDGTDFKIVIPRRRLDAKA